jgi:hypothetical protein
MFLDNLLYNNFMYMFEGFFDNEPIVGRTFDNVEFNLEIISILPEESIILVTFTLDDFASFTVSLDLELHEAKIVGFCDEDNTVILDSDLGSVCKEFARIRLDFAISYFRDMYDKSENLYENIEVYDYDIETIENKSEVSVKSKLKPKNKKILKSVDLGIGSFITKLINKDYITITSCIGHEPDDKSYVCLMCKKENVPEIMKIITEHFEPKNVTYTQDSSYWIPLKDGKEFYNFEWK